MSPGHLIATPLGDVVLRADDDFLTGVFFVGQKHFPTIMVEPSSRDAPPLVREAGRQLAEFFAGERRAFTVPFRLSGTPFQQRVWRELAGIPYGTVVSYGTIADRLGLGGSHARAVGSAIGRNPVSVIVPCHRVVAGTGHLTGYAGGMHRKQALLRLEQPADALAPFFPQHLEPSR